MKTMIAFLLVLLPIFSNGQIITTIAGTHINGYGGDGGAATNAQFNHPNGLAIDAAGNIYISDYSNHRVRKVTAAGIVSTIAGTGVPGYSGDGGPATIAKLHDPIGLAFDQLGNLYVADATNNAVRKIDITGTITTVAGASGALGDDGDGGPATAAHFRFPVDVAFDGIGNLYVADFSNNRIRKITPSGIVTAFAGNGTAGFSGDGTAATTALLAKPYGMKFLDNEMYFADYGNNRIRKISTTGIISTIAGNGTPGYSGDGGPATAAEMNFLETICFDSARNLYIPEFNNHVIRKITPAGGISTIAGIGGVAGYSGDGGAATIATFHSPGAVCIDALNNMYIADYNNDVVRKIGDSTAVTITKVGEVESSDVLSVYPNPAAEFLDIRVNDVQVWQVTISNLLGEKILAQQLSASQKIDIRNLTPGVYTLIFRNGKKIIEKKVDKAVAFKVPC